MNSKRRKNRFVLGALIIPIAVMLGVVAYSPTIYRLVCSATGIGGTTQRIDEDNAHVSDKIITVRFDTNVAPGLDWRFEPVKREVKVHLGEEALVFFKAENLTDAPIVGHATFNVTPEKVGSYFKKVQCFCFDDERLEPHQSVNMPVDFFVDPALTQDSTAQEVDTITLSYTFFRAKDGDEAKDLSRFVASAAPDAHRGQDLFAQRCAGCHAIDRNKAGPMLRGVLGRKGATAPGYHYSAALRAAGLTWTKEALDRWLAGPRDFVPGAMMPVKVLDPTSRRDIIAYLAQESGVGGTAVAVRTGAPSHN